MSVSEWIENINHNKGLDNYSRWNTPFRNSNQQYYFSFIEDFTTNDFTSFNIRIELDNEQVFTASTQTIKFI